MGSKARKDAWSNDGCERVRELSEVGSQSEVPGEMYQRHMGQSTTGNKTEAEPEPAWWAEPCLIARVERTLGTPALLQACPDPSLKAKLHAMTLVATTVQAFKFFRMTVGSSKQRSSEGGFEEAGRQSHIRKKCGNSVGRA